MWQKFILIFVILSLVEGCPVIINRANWNARAPKKVTMMKKTPEFVIIHHTVTGQCNNANSCPIIRSIQNDHMDNRKFDDIGYNFLIDHNGNIFEGRGWGVSGAHAPGYNSRSIGIAFIGNYQTTNANSAVKKEAVQSLISCGTSSGKISSNYKLLGHRQVKATDCPGNKLYEDVKTWPNWSPNP